LIVFIGAVFCIVYALICALKDEEDDENEEVQAVRTIKKKAVAETVKLAEECQTSQNWSWRELEINVKRLA
jgi:hypothetical protein